MLLTMSVETVALCIIDEDVMLLITSVLTVALDIITEARVF